MPIACKCAFWHGCNYCCAEGLIPLTHMTGCGPQNHLNTFPYCFPQSAAAATGCNTHVKLECSLLYVGAEPLCAWTHCAWIRAAVTTCSGPAASRCCATANPAVLKVTTLGRAMWERYIALYCGIAVWTRCYLHSHPTCCPRCCCLLTLSHCCTTAACASSKGPSPSTKFLHLRAQALNRNKSCL